MADTTNLVPDLPSVASPEITESTETTPVVSNVESLSEALQIQICSESEKSEPQTTANIENLTESSDIVKNDVPNEIDTSVDSTPAETVDKPCDTVIDEPDMGNMADSSTSQEEVTESEVKSSGNVEHIVPKIIEPDESNFIDKPVEEDKEVIGDIPMEVDIVSESETKDKVEVDEPSSTSTDITL